MRRRSLRRAFYAGVSIVAMSVQTLSPALAAESDHGGDHGWGDHGWDDHTTLTPIKHVIIIIGENRTFDHVFGAYQPKHGQRILNLLSEGIINVDGTPGPRYAAAVQDQASDTDSFSISPTITGPYATLPPPNTAGTPEAASDTAPPPFATTAAAAAADYGLLPQDIVLLTTGASGLPTHSIDTRIANATNLPSGPFRLSPGVSDDAYAASPVHRFYQMWQQTDCSVAHGSAANPSGCVGDLFPWVEVSIGAGSNGAAQPAGFNDESTHEGATSMGFYDMAEGDLAYFKKLADEYTINDNYHQAVMGGTGANHIMLGSGDAFWYSDGHGNAMTPPANEIENPNPQTGTNDYYTQDGYSGGSYSECSDTTQPGVAPITSYLSALPDHPKPNCQPGHYYLLNNYNPGYFGDGTVDTTDTFTIPPSSTPTIADDLMAHGISWHYYGEGWNAYVKNPASPANVYCNICNPFQYETRIMTNPAIRTKDLKDTSDLYNDIADGTLPAVSFVKPGGLNDGHPSSSKYDIFGAFVKKILVELKANPELWEHTAVFITNDEGGGYYDSGYIQPVDYFGDGTRVPLIIVSPYSRGGRVVHGYADHVSLLKFIERNWRLPTITDRSRDNLPDPVASRANPWVPTNGPAIDDLMNDFQF
ncbi:MAG TPA: alkaline phosphatase family protein [Acetobacteraceae bacterium]|nr:alkaline phosphatase family protein [Acetobacteraceae bacterium]